MSSHSTVGNQFSRLLQYRLGQRPNNLLALGLNASPSPAQGPLAKSLQQTGDLVTKQLEDATKVRKLLEILSFYRAPPISPDAAAIADVTWPDYTMEKFAKEVNDFAFENQKRFTLTMVESATQIQTVATSIKENMNRIFTLLDSKAAATEFKAPLIKVRLSAQRGAKQAYDMQGEVISINQEVAKIHDNVERLKQGYAPIVPKLNAAYDDWAKKHDMPPSVSVNVAFDKIKEKIEKLKHEVEEKESGMIAAGTTGSVTIFFFGLCALACSIAVGILGEERVQLLDKITELQQESSVLQGAIQIAAFVDTAMNDIRTVRDIVDAFQKLAKVVGDAFISIAEYFTNIDKKAEDNVGLIEEAVAPDPNDMRDILASLDTILDLAAMYKKYGLQVESIEPVVVRPAAA